MKTTEVRPQKPVVPYLRWWDSLSYSEHTAIIIVENMSYEQTLEQFKQNMSFLYNKYKHLIK